MSHRYTPDQATNSAAGCIAVAVWAVLTAATATAAHARGVLTTGFEDVPLWGRFEATVTGTRGYANPFTDVEFRATFCRPDKSRVAFWGFHDGNGLFPFLFAGLRPKFDGGSNVDWLRPSIQCRANVDQILGELEARQVVWFNHGGMLGWEWSGNGRLLVPPAARRAVLRYWMARLAPYWNVTWNLVGEWLDPRTGTRKRAAMVENGATQTFTCPEARDWVLHLHREGDMTPGEGPRAADFFVSPQGKDTWSGRSADPSEFDGPFATVARAREAVRALRRTQKEPQCLSVIIRGGTYCLDAPLEFGPEDSGMEQAPVVYRAAAGEKVVLSGGRRLENGRWDEVNGRKAWVVDIPEVKAGTWRFRQLFVNGQRRPRTRLPKQGEYRIESLPAYTGDFLRSPTRRFVYAPGNIVSTWRNLQDVEVVGITRWLDNRLPIESVNGETRTVTFDRPSLFALVAGSKPGVYWVENVFEALDTPGQWYLDRPRGVLYYLPRPGEEMPSAEIIAPRLEQVVRVVGHAGTPVHDLRFEGLTFAHTEWQPSTDYASSLQAGIEVPGALLFDHAERCAVTDGGIEHIGNYGVEVGVGCADIEIARNRITDLGAGGIRIGHFFSWETDGSGRMTERGLQRKAAMPTGPHSRRITVADNEIAHGGRFTPEAVGVFVGDNADNQIIHNHIYDLFYSGISVGSVQDFGPSEARGNIIEYNHVHDIGQGMLSDLAGIYTCSTPGSRIAYNIVHDVTRRDYGGWGIYPDQGSHDLLIEKNLVYRCQDGALFAHHNRDITAQNNIFAFNRIAQVERGGTGGFELTFRRNLVYYLEGKAVGSYGSRRCGRDVCAFDRNLYWNASGPAVLFASQSFSEWQATGQDKDSLIADPLFVDPRQGDFTLRPGSPAAQIGFEPWDMSAIGPRQSW